MPDTQNAILFDLGIMERKLSDMVLVSELSLPALPPQRQLEAQRSYIKHLRAAMAHVESARTWLEAHSA